MFSIISLSNGPKQQDIMEGQCIW